MMIDQSSFSLRNQDTMTNERHGKEKRAQMNCWFLWVNDKKKMIERCCCCCWLFIKKEERRLSI